MKTREEMRERGVSFFAKNPDFMVKRSEGKRRGEKNWRNCKKRC